MSIFQFRVKKLFVGIVASALVAAPLLFVTGTASADPASWSSTNSTPIDLSNYGDFNNGSDTVLNGVSCFTGTSCVAAGDVSSGFEKDNPMQLTGDAQTWGVGGGGATNGDDSNGDNAVSDPNPGSSLSYFDLSKSEFPGASINSISCLATAATCVSVGFDGAGAPFLLLGDPTTWSSDKAYELTDGISSANSLSHLADLLSVSCVSDDENEDGLWCEAVGYNELTFDPIEISGDPATWSNTAFAQLPFATADGVSADGALSSVSCVSVGECVAVGEVQVQTDSASLRSRIHVRNSIRHHAVDAQSDIAVGDYLLSFNGDPTTWSTESPVLIPVTADYKGYLEGVSCTSSNNCVAVGTEYDQNEYGVTSEPIFLTGDPTQWATSGYVEYIVGDSNADGPGGELNGVSCPTSNYCAAVGFEGNNEDQNEVPLVVSGDPSTWADDSTTNADATPITPQNVDNPWGYFMGVSCTAVDTCVAVGYFDQYYNDDPGPFTAWIAPPVQSASSAPYVPTLYPVTYVAGGASGAPPTQAPLSAGSTFTVASATSLSDPGYTFTGWSDGTTVYQPGSTYTMPAAPVTLTAQWTPLPASPSSVTKPLLRTEVLFPFNKYYLTAQAKRQLIAFAKAIEKAQVTSFTVVGSTDLFGSEGYNIPLSEHRAHVVSKYLTGQLALLGVSDVVFHDTWIGILKTQPTYTQNRRTVVAD